MGKTARQADGGNKASGESRLIGGNPGTGSRSKYSLQINRDWQMYWPPFAPRTLFWRADAFGVSSPN